MATTDRPRYRIGVPEGGYWVEILNTDAELYGGSNTGNAGGCMAEEIVSQARPYSLNLRLPPLATVVLAPESLQDWFHQQAKGDAEVDGEIEAGLADETATDAALDAAADAPADSALETEAQAPDTEPLPSTQPSKPADVGGSGGEDAATATGSKPAAPTKANGGKPGGTKR